METLAQKLQKFLENKNVTPAALAKSCGIDRSTMFQYVHSKRSLKNQEHLETIMDHLTLTLSERQELTEAFEIEKVGYQLFCRRKKIERFIYSLPSFSDVPESASTPPLGREGSASLEPAEGYIPNRAMLSQTLFSLLHAAYEKGEDIKILMQPAEASVLNLLIHPVFRNLPIRISHIFCLDNLSNDCSDENIDRYHALVYYFLQLDNYEPFYFYGNTKERFGFSNPFPYFICTESFALQVAADENSGILHSDSRIVKGFLNLFSTISDCCMPLGKNFRGLEQELDWYGKFMTEKDLFSEVIGLTPGICGTPFFTKALIDKYLNSQIPESEKLKATLTQYCAKLYRYRRNGDIKILSNPSYMLEFIKTGKLKEYPEMLLEKPFEKKDRKFFLERILQACREGWFQICFLDDAFFPFQPCWEIGIQKNNVIIQYFHTETFRILLIREHDFVEEMRDYLESLWETKGISGDDAVKLIETWMKQYLD